MICVIQAELELYVECHKQRAVNNITACIGVVSLA